MPTQWKSAAAAITTSASRSVMPWSETIAGTIPRRNSSRARRSAMFVTIWMWTHEWSVSPRRPALTPATCHHALTCGSALTASMSWSSLRLPRVGARMRIAAIASAGAGRAVGRSSASSSIEARVLLPELQPAAVVLDRDRALAVGRREGRAQRRGLARLQHDLPADAARGGRAVHLAAVGGLLDARHEPVGERGARPQAVAVAAEQVDVGRAQADRAVAVVDDAPEEEVVAGRAGDCRGPGGRLPAQRPVLVRGAAPDAAGDDRRKDRQDCCHAQDSPHVASLERTRVRNLALFGAEWRAAPGASRDRA